VSTPTPPPDPAAIERERPYLLRYAMLHLRRRDLAEDAVQETLLAALEGAAAFGGRSTLRTWLTGILRHKISDGLRRLAREQPVAAGEDEDPQDVIEAMFQADGHWVEPPADWGDPQRAFEERAFWEALQRCVDGLPAKTGRAFLMREVMELSTDEICKELGITPTHCWVMLHRARLALRQCLETGWFGKR